MNYTTEEPDPISREEVTLCRHAFRNYATEIMRFMAVRGSNMRLLKIKSDVEPNCRPARDLDGLQWPRYTYAKGRTINAHGMSEVVALPAPGACHTYPDMHFLLCA